MATPGWRQFPLSDDPMRVLAHSPASRSGLPITVLPIPGRGESDNAWHPTARIFVALQGSGQRWTTQGRQTQRLRTAPRMIEMFEAGLSIDHCRWEGEAGRCVMIEFPEADVDAMTHGALPALSLPTRHELFDEGASRLAVALAHETFFGTPAGPLYVQGLCVALLGLLAQHYDQSCGSIGAAVSPGATLSKRQRAKVDALIEAELGSQLSLARMAEAVNLSSHHFARAFKASFGSTPHAYVQQRRVQAAAAALRSGRFPSIAAVALAHGFSSQSHLTELMRKQLGVTPGSLVRGFDG